MDNLSSEFSSFKKLCDNETQILAEMVKALAEISKTQKLKMEKVENSSLSSSSEMSRLEETIKKFQVEDASNREAFGSQIKLLRTVQELKIEVSQHILI
jgi:hypothetical protein